jgi:hypothetical protein
MQLRFSGRLNLTQAIPSATWKATVSASIRAFIRPPVALVGLL